MTVWPERTLPIRSHQPHFVNLRAGPEAENWSATVYVRNLTDDDTPFGAFRFPNYAINPIFTTPGAVNDSSGMRPFIRTCTRLRRKPGAMSALNFSCDSAVKLFL